MLGEFIGVEKNRDRVSYWHAAFQAVGIEIEANGVGLTRVEYPVQIRYEDPDLRFVETSKAKSVGFAHLTPRDVLLCTA